MKIKIVLISLLLVVLNFGNAGHAKETRIINRHGTQIPSIFYGLSPNPKITPEYFRFMKRIAGMLARARFLRRPFTANPMALHGCYKFKGVVAVIINGK